MVVAITSSSAQCALGIYLKCTAISMALGEQLVFACFSHICKERICLYLALSLRIYISDGLYY